VTHDIFLVLASTTACAVEMVEALTIVLAVSVTRGWRSAVIGTVTALAALAVVVAALGPALTVLPIDGFRVFVGALLLIFGLQWVRKAILRSSGYKALHDEDAIFAEEQRAAAAAAPDREGIDWYTFTVSFKGVFLEGLEVAFIVLTFGGANHNIGLAALGAAVAAVVVLSIGVVVHRPLSQVPENAMKHAVGVMLTTFGIFWAGEGAGVDWPGGDAAIIAILGFVILMVFSYVTLLRRRHEALVPA